MLDTSVKSHIDFGFEALTAPGSVVRHAFPNQPESAAKGTSASN
jgi:hypothetical protein